MAEEGLICWNCGAVTGIVGRVMRNDACTKCLADLRCCRGCRFFDPYAKLQCRENIDSGVKNKEKSNFCDFFQLRDRVKRPGGMAQAADSKDELKKKFDDLFDD